MKFFQSFCVSPKILLDSFIIFGFIKLKLFPFAVRLSAEILSPYGEFPSKSRFLEFSLFLVILLNHLPQEVQIPHLLGFLKTSVSLLGQVSDASNFSNSSILAIGISPFAKFSCKSMSWKE